MSNPPEYFCIPPMLRSSADSTGYWLVWVTVMAGQWVKEGGFSGDPGRFGEDSVVIGVKKGRNGVSMAVDVVEMGVYSSYTPAGSQMKKPPSDEGGLVAGFRRNYRGET